MEEGHQQSPQPGLLPNSRRNLPHPMHNFEAQVSAGRKNISAASLIILKLSQ